MATADDFSTVTTRPLSGLGDDVGSTEAELPTTVVTAKPIPAKLRRARTIQNAPETPPEPPAPPPTPGPTLEFPLQVVRQPRGGLSLNGERVDHLLLEMDVVNNRFYSADSFRCTLLLSERDPDFGRAFWQDVDRLDVEFFVGFGVDEAPSTSILAGRADEIEVDLARRQVRLIGRDHTADLIERQITEKYPNKSSSEIVKILAGEAGLTPVVTETSGLAGVYYRAEHAQLADETTAWNLITYLAEREGFDAYVKGKELHFEPPPDPVTAPKWTLQYVQGEEGAPFPQAPVGGLTLTKSLTVSRDVVVKVVSWNSSKKHSLTGTSKSTLPRRSSQGKGMGSAAGKNQSVTHVFRIPNLTQDQADERARQLAEDITKKLRSFDADGLPGVAEIDIRTIVTIAGTGGSFDTAYHLDSISRSMSQQIGFTMRLSGRNVSPESTVAL